ncbi:hypothetical protein U14_04804 [Candidatus Moduliflexus flocculans]|uniref:Putative Se/S carrier protein-like domain-containing protein n=1 Tax=Candidatus Moduliflexus flocculans TaxID=1499966 RepID=A0A0S6W4T8_9BACT|nr:hypothetical protein U14_04804 [Candidatus Moduliflexus flocculans]
MNSGQYAVILLQSTSHALRGEKILKQAGIASKLIPVPRILSSECGVCLRIRRDDQERARQAFEAVNLQIVGIHEI